MHKIDNNITGGSQHVRDHEFIDTSRFTGILQGGKKASRARQWMH